MPRISVERRAYLQRFSEIDQTAFSEAGSIVAGSVISKLCGASAFTHGSAPGEWMQHSFATKVRCGISRATGPGTGTAMLSPGPTSEIFLAAGRRILSQGNSLFSATAATTESKLFSGTELVIGFVPILLGGLEWQGMKRRA